MTGKRFTSEYNNQSDMIQYIDTQKEEPNRWSVCNVSETLKKLNNLHKENQSLKFQLDECRNHKLFSRRELEKENEQLKSDKEHLMGCLIRFFGYDDEDIDYNLNRESNREYGKQYYSMKEETKKELEE